MIAAFVMTAAMFLFSGMASAQCPAAGKCQGNCPTLYRHGVNNAINVPPYSSDGTGKCHKIKGECKCEYRVSGNENTCTLNQTTHLCGGDCPTLYATPEDAQAQTNPISFAHMDCNTFTTNNVQYCVCIYY